MNREQWLSQAVLSLNETVFKPNGYEVPNVKVSVGFCSKKKAIGQYFHTIASADKVPQIFIHPTIGDGVKALDVLVHELCHAVTEGDGHGKLFGKAAKAVGLEGKKTNTNAGETLKKTLGELHTTLGVYPQSALSLGDKKQGGGGLQTLFKVECGDCGFHARIGVKFHRAGQYPLCPCNSKEMVLTE